MAYSTYRQCYRILGVAPSCDWQELRTAYRRKVRTCHPDLATQGADRNADVAGREESFKEAVQAFRLLAGYYRRYGVLPSPHVPLMAARAGERYSVVVPQARGHARRARRPARPRAWPVQIPRFHQLAVAGFLVTIGVAAAANYLAVDETATTPSPSSIAYASDAELEFGMKPLDVMDLQGVPNFTKGSVWFYGNSGVVFDKGCVVAWENTPPFPLRTRIPANSLRERQRSTGIDEPSEPECRFDGRR